MRTVSIADKGSQRRMGWCDDTPHPNPPPQGGRGPEKAAENKARSLASSSSSSSLPPCGGGPGWGVNDAARPFHTASRRTLILLTLTLLILAPGCKVTGYSIRPPYDTRVKTVYVPVFKSVTFRRDINLMLTELVIKEIERRSPYKVVGTPEGADTTLEGTINFSDKNVILENPYNLPRQLTTTMVVLATWTDNKAEEKKPPNPAYISETFNFYPEIGETTQAAYYRTCEKLAIQIVNMMEEPW